MIIECVVAWHEPRWTAAAEHIIILYSQFHWKRKRICTQTTYVRKYIHLLMKIKIRLRKWLTVFFRFPGTFAVCSSRIFERSARPPVADACIDNMPYGHSHIGFYPFQNDKHRPSSSFPIHRIHFPENRKSLFVRILSHCFPFTIAIVTRRLLLFCQVRTHAAQFPIKLSSAGFSH